MSPTTYRVRVFETGQAPPADWRPWVNVKPADVPMLGAMAANQYIRFRGGLAESEPALGLTVHIWTPDVPAGADGQPSTYLGETFNVTRGPRS